MGEKSEVRGLDKRKRDQEWRDIRVGFARPLDETKRTYVAAMADYDNVTDQVFSAAVERGLSERTQVVAVADGAVDYEKARASGYPTGSGEVESAHRYIPQKRLKIPGAGWAPATINPMLALRVMRENDWWESF